MPANPTPEEEYNNTLDLIIDYAQSAKGRKFQPEEFTKLTEALFEVTGIMYSVVEGTEVLLGQEEEVVINKGDTL